MRDLRTFINELRQRKVFRVASIYVVSAWGAALGASELLPNFGVEHWVIKALVIGLLALFPVVVLLAWFFEVTRDGVVRDPRDLPADARQTHHTLRGADTALLESPGTLVQGLEVVWMDRGVEKRRVWSTAFTAGRDGECGVSTLDPVASRHHARFEPEGSHWVVSDLGSSNGTLLDGERITHQQLPMRCRVELGRGGQALDIRILNREAQTMILAAPDSGNAT